MINYIVLISVSPENFGLEIDQNFIMQNIKDFLIFSEEEEIVALVLESAGSINKEDPEHVSITNFINKFFENIHRINFENIYPDVKI